MIYSIQLWEAREIPNINILRSLQPTSFRLIINDPWHVSNHTLYHDLKIETISVLATHVYKHFYSRTYSHIDPFMSKLFEI